MAAGPLSRPWGAEPWVVGVRCVPSAGGAGTSLLAGACELLLAGPQVYGAHGPLTLLSMDVWRAHCPLGLGFFLVNSEYVEGF